VLKFGVFRFNAFALFCCGVILSAALPPLGLFPLLLALCPLFILVATSDRFTEAFGYGFFFAVGFFALYLIWLPASFADLYGIFFWLLYPPMLAILGVFWGIVTGSSRLLGGYGQGTLWLLPVLWVLMEWARAQGYFGFPWGTLGYAWLGTPVAQLADVAGVYGLSLLTLVVISLISSPFVNSDAMNAFVLVRPLLVAVLLLGSVFGYGIVRERQLEPLADTPYQALLAQGNTDAFGRTVGGESEVGLYTRLTTNARREVGADAADIDLVIYPEFVVSNASLSFPRSDSYAQTMNRLADAAGDAALITGAGAIEDGRSYNSAFSIADRRVQDRYDKVYLVPFGEIFFLINTALFRPVYRFIFVDMFGLPMLASRSPGEDINPLVVTNRQTGTETPTATYICYESVFPQVARQMVGAGAQVLVNISNDAWFGRGMGARQHFLMGNMRAIETRRYLLRVGNDGITALIDPLGQVVTELPRAIQDTLLVNYNLRRERTLYVRFGDWLIVVLVIVAVMLSVRGRSSRNAFV
jgi:apolipoprotein N-acyltransferase